MCFKLRDLHLQADAALHRPWLEKADATWSNKAAIWQASRDTGEISPAASPPLQHQSASATPAACTAGSRVSQQDRLPAHEDPKPHHRKRSSFVRFRVTVDEDIERIASGAPQDAVHNLHSCDDTHVPGSAPPQTQTASDTPQASVSTQVPSLLTNAAHPEQRHNLVTEQSSLCNAASAEQAVADASSAVLPCRALALPDADMGCAAEQMPQLPTKLLQDAHGRTLAHLHLHQVCISLGTSAKRFVLLTRETCSFHLRCWHSTASLRQSARSHPCRL